MDIDTQSAQYQQYLNGLEGLRAMMAPRFALFKKLPESKQRIWLQRDPLFRKVLKLSLKVSEWARQFEQETQDD